MGAPLLVDDEVPERVLVVTARPDDVDFGAGGSIAGGRPLDSQHAGT